MTNYQSGLRLAIENSLHIKEMEALFPLIQMSTTRKGLANFLDVPEKTLHRPLQKLREKELVVTNERTGTGAFIFSFNKEKYP